MKKGILSLFVPLIGLAGECSPSLLKEHFPLMPEVKVLSAEERFGLCEFVISSGAGAFTVYASKDFAIAGAMVSRGVNLSQESILKAQAQQVKEILPKLSEIAIKEGTGDKVVYMITDPECPYCEGSKKRVYELAKQKGWAVAIVFFPIKPQSEAKVVSFICENRGWQDYLNGLYGTSKCERGLSSVVKARELLQELVSGTPTFILSTGEMIVGANLRALEEKLK